MMCLRLIRKWSTCGKRAKYRDNYFDNYLITFYKKPSKIKGFRTIVRVQVPPPAVKKQDCCPAFFMHLIARHPCKQNYFDLTKMSVWHIIHLIRQLEGECTSPDPAKFNT